ncbi:hypothetical protein SAMN05216571_104284 [Onishia taeanensis]|uniref:Uncharacterized protein n=1 Tax=Onishia taeanensis TaxID=284577 RepID=A0A1G7RID6_9GAMM|nr:hypothetical protein SAMN05216571_104284 [Halomonas taeanensis]
MTTVVGSVIYDMHEYISTTHFPGTATNELKLYDILKLVLCCRFRVVNIPHIYATLFCEQLILIRTVLRVAGS